VLLAGREHKRMCTWFSSRCCCAKAGQQQEATPHSCTWTTLHAFAHVPHRPCQAPALSSRNSTSSHWPSTWRSQRLQVRLRCQTNRLPALSAGVLTLCASWCVRYTAYMAICHQSEVW